MTTRHRVLIVDDNPRVPLFVYRTLTLAIELDSPTDAETESQRAEVRAKRRLESPDGRFQLDWIDPRGELAADIVREFREHLAGAGDPGTLTWAILDVRLNENRGNEDLPRPESSQEEPTLTAQLAAIFLEHRFPTPASTSPEPARRLFVVSSYVSQNLTVEGHAPIKVRTKSPATLELIRELIRKAIAAAPTVHPPRSTGRVSTAPNRPLQILITGAGFELREPGSDLFRFGMPDTAQLLYGMSRYANEGLSKADWANPAAQEWLELIFPDPDPDFGDPFPMPKCIGPKKLKEALISAARQRNLDVYWDLVLTNAQHRLAENPHYDAKTGKHEMNYQAAGRIADEEVRLRQAFRSAICDYDEGQLEQAIWAARGDWDVWLTTNYTRFSDRAIHLCAGGPGSTRRWDLIANKNAAAALLRPRVMQSIVQQTPMPRMFIKLHGDIGQINTMAIAGYDKQAQSSFVVRPELHMMYAAATEMLTQEAARYRRCWWHIVGHSMWDDALVRTIERVMSRSWRHAQHEFVVVTPDERGATRVRKIIESRYRDLAMPGATAGAFASVPVPTSEILRTARDYLGRLRWLRWDVPSDVTLREWLDAHDLRKPAAAP